MAVNYKFIDDKIGLTSSAIPTAGVPAWVASTVYAALSQVTRGGFLFATVAGGTSSTVGPTPQYLTDGTVTWVLKGPVGGPCQSDSSAKHELGYIALAKDDTYGVAELIYVKFTGATAIVAGDAVQIDRSGITCPQTGTTLASSNSPIAVGIAMGSHALDVATPTYGWVLIRGVHDNANVTTSSTSGYVCSLGAAAGRVLGTGYVSNKTIHGMIARSISANNQGAVELFYPMASGVVIALT
jgi:hypothetical protein